MRRSLALAALAATPLLGGCQTGARPTLEPTDPITDANVATLVDDLSSARAATFTARYEITSTSTGELTPAVVTNDGGRYQVKIGDVGYIANGAETQTCTAKGCETGLNDAYVSDLNLTHRFWASSFEARLRLDSKRNIGNTASTTETIADQQARCVTIPLSGGAVEYCTIANGPLALYTGPDVRIELKSYTPSIEPGALGT